MAEVHSLPLRLLSGSHPHHLNSDNQHAAHKPYLKDRPPEKARAVCDAVLKTHSFFSTTAE